MDQHQQTSRDKRDKSDKREGQKVSFPGKSWEKEAVMVRNCVCNCMLSSSLGWLAWLTALEANLKNTGRINFLTPYQPYHFCRWFIVPFCTPSARHFAIDSVQAGTHIDSPSTGRQACTLARQKRNKYHQNIANPFKSYLLLPGDCQTAQKEYLKLLHNIYIYICSTNRLKAIEQQQIHASFQLPFYPENVSGFSLKQTFYVSGFVDQKAVSKGTDSSPETSVDLWTKRVQLET